MIRVVPDTNILISSIFWEGKPNKVILDGIQGKYDLLTSAEIIGETIEKLRNKFYFPEKEIDELVRILLSFFDVIDTNSNFNIVRDKNDNKILECAFDGKADFIVTGDKDLLILKEFKGIRILTAGAFLKSVFR